MQCSFCPTSAFLLTRPKFYFGAAFFLFAGNHRVRHSVLRVGCRKSAENYLLTLHEGGFSALKEQQHFSVPSAPFLSLVITELPGFATAPAKVAPAAHSRLYSCNSLLKEGSAPSFQVLSSFRTWHCLHLPACLSAISVSGDELSLAEPKHTSWARFWTVGWAWVLSQWGSVHSVQSWLKLHSGVCSL